MVWWRRIQLFQIVRRRAPRSSKISNGEVFKMSSSDFNWWVYFKSPKAGFETWFSFLLSLNTGFAESLHRWYMWIRPTQVLFGHVPCSCVNVQMKKCELFKLDVIIAINPTVPTSVHSWYRYQLHHMIWYTPDIWCLDLLCPQFKWLPSLKSYIFLLRGERHRD